MRGTIVVCRPLVASMLSSFMYPLQWPHAYIPVVSDEALDMLQYGAIFCGMLTSQLAEASSEVLESLEAGHGDEWVRLRAQRQYPGGGRRHVHGRPLTGGGGRC